MVEMKPEKVPVGDKKIGSYLAACFISLNKTGGVIICARGNNITGAINVLAILIREYLDDPEYTIEVGSEKYEERYVSSIDIHLKGNLKNATKFERRK